MLQTRTVSRELLAILERLMQETAFEPFFLVGGTALALQIGHRESIDIDFFGDVEIDVDETQSILEQLGEFVQIKKSKNIFITQINGIKVDFVNYKYPLIDAPIVEGVVRMASKKDIAAMKLNAILGRGSKKDFIDLYYLLSYFTINEMIGFYKEKYYDGIVFQMIKSLSYFGDADLQETPKMFDKSFNWEKCKATILEKISTIT